MRKSGDEEIEVLRSKVDLDVLSGDAKNRGWPERKTGGRLLPVNGSRLRSSARSGELAVHKSHAIARQRCMEAIPIADF